MKAYRVELFIVNHDNLSSDEVIDVIENTKFPNRCIYPLVRRIEFADIGEWHDDHADPSDVVIWGPGEGEFLANVGRSRVQDVMVAFDADAANAALIVAAVNALPAFLEAVEELARVKLQLETVKRNRG